MTMKAVALRGSSALAIGRSMRRIVLPALFTACAAVAIPENQLRAYDASSPGNHFADTKLAALADSKEVAQTLQQPEFAVRTILKPVIQGSRRATMTGSASRWLPAPATGQAVPVPPAPGGGIVDHSLVAIVALERGTATARRALQVQAADNDGSQPRRRDREKSPFQPDVIGKIAAFWTEKASPKSELGLQLTTDIVLADKTDAERRSNARTWSHGALMDLTRSASPVDVAVFEGDNASALIDAGPIVADPPTASAGNHPWPRTVANATVLLSSQPGHALRGTDGRGDFEEPLASTMSQPTAPNERWGAGPNAFVAAPPDFVHPTQEGVPSVFESVSAPDVWKSERHPVSFDHAVTGSMSGTDVIVGQDGVTLVKVGALAEMLSEQFDFEKLVRLRSFDDGLHNLPVDELQHFGIPVIFDRGDTLRLTTSLAQAGGSALPNGGAGGDAVGLSAGAVGNESLLATASVGFDSNPFLSAGESPEAISMRLRLNPSLTRANGRSSLRASGRVEHIEYLGQYGSLQNFGADLSGRHRLNERLEASAAALFRRDILGTDLTNPLSSGPGVDPGVPVIPGGNDVTILGQRQRRTQYGADTGLTFTPSERDQLSWNLAWRSDRFGSEGLSDSDFFSQQLRYSRQVSGSLSLGAIVDASIINFTGRRFGDAQTVTPQALIVFGLSERLKATGSLGLALTRIETPAGDETSRAFAGNMSFCYESERSNLCLNGARQVLPSAIGGARVQTTAGVSYSFRLSERDSLQLGGNYSIASQPLATNGNEFENISALNGNEFESINAFARYERRLSERARLFVSGGYLDTSGNAAVSATNVQAVMGITINFGTGQ